MWWWFNKKMDKPKKQVDVMENFWKDDFSDCEAIKYLPEYSVCKCRNNRQCRYVAMYAGMVLCSSPKHKSFIPEGSEPFDPHKNLF